MAVDLAGKLTAAMDQNSAPLVEALAGITGTAGTGHPARVTGRPGEWGDRNTSVIGAEAFRADVLAAAGLDARPSSNGYLKRAEELMVDEVRAELALSPPAAVRYR